MKRETFRDGWDIPKLSIGSEGEADKLIGGSEIGTGTTISSSSIGPALGEAETLLLSTSTGTFQLPLEVVEASLPLSFL